MYRCTMSQRSWRRRQCLIALMIRRGKARCKALHNGTHPLDVQLSFATSEECGFLSSPAMLAISGLLYSAMVRPSTIGCGERPSISRRLAVKFGDFSGGVGHACMQNFSSLCPSVQELCCSQNLDTYIQIYIDCDV